MRFLPCYLLVFWLWSVPSLQAQFKDGSRSGKERAAWFLSHQPLVFAEPSGGFKAGGEVVLAQRFGLGLDLAARFNNYIETDLQDGEKNRRRGYQVQPEFRYYFHGRGVRARRRGFRPITSAAGVRAGYTQYHTDFTTWTNLVDGSGNAYEKLLSHTRIQRNYDLTLVFSTKFYFKKQGEGLGLEFFSGFGVRIKRFSYINVPPELSADQLRQADENRRFTLLRDGSYPVFPTGVRIFYRLSR